MVCSPRSGRLRSFDVLSNRMMFRIKMTSNAAAIQKSGPAIHRPLRVITNMTMNCGAKNDQQADRSLAKSDKAKNIEKEELDNDYLIRRKAVDFNVPLITNIQLAKRFVEALSHTSFHDLKIKSWNEYV
jgi:hypothetical protein